MLTLKSSCNHKLNQGLRTFIELIISIYLIRSQSILTKRLQGRVGRVITFFSSGDVEKCLPLILQRGKKEYVIMILLGFCLGWARRIATFQERS